MDLKTHKNFVNYLNFKKEEYKVIIKYIINSQLKIIVKKVTKIQFGRKIIR